MERELPDVAMDARPEVARALRWVGMEGIDLPMRVDGERVAAAADVAVDLPRSRVKGIHMSRLYRLVGALADADLPGPVRLRGVLREVIDSHVDCGATAARLRLRFGLLRARPALVTPALSGWRAYPIALMAALGPAGARLRARVDVTYASTCPCSAALSRQVLAETFLREMGEGGALAPDRVAAWLAERGSVATPHSQRSVATVTVDVAPDGGSFGLDALIDHVETALGTPVQTAVKRADEQAFARRNGANLMYVEDATRRVLGALADRPEYRAVTVAVRHLESLHPHDAVAQGEG